MLWNNHIPRGIFPPGEYEAELVRGSEREAHPD